MSLRTPHHAPGRGTGWHKARRAALWLTLALVAMAFATPLIWMLSASFKPADMVHSSEGRLGGLLPVQPEPSAADESYLSFLLRTIRANYQGVWDSRTADFPLYLRNSLIIAALSVTGTLVSSAIVAYGFSRVRWRGRDTVFLLVLATLMIPATVVVAPQYLLFRSLGMIGSLMPLWVPAWFGGGAFSIFLLRQFFLAIPRELDEAATIDGCSHIGIFIRIILPLARPALVVVALLTFVACWNEFLSPLVFLNHERHYTLSLGLYLYQSQHGGTPWNMVMAASVMTIAPVLIVFLLAQRSIIEGVAAQGVKE